MENPTPPTLPVLTYDRYDARKDRRGFLRVILGFWLGIIVACLLNALVFSALTYFAPQLLGYDLFDIVANIFALIIISPLFCVLTLPFALYFQRRIKKEVRFVSLLSATLWGLVYALPILAIRFFYHFGPVTFWLTLILFFGWLILFPILPSFWLCYRSHLRD